MDIEPIWRGRGFTIDEKLCFVLMPFGDPFNIIYQDHLKPAIERWEFRCVRADDIHGARPITEDTWEYICRARVIVAELTDRNPNVFYEIGMAHTLGKQVVLITQTIDDVPFDLRTLRCIIYEYNPRGMKKLENMLEKSLQAILSPTPALLSSSGPLEVAHQDNLIGKRQSQPDAIEQVQPKTRPVQQGKQATTARGPQVLALAGLIVTLFACIAGWLALPQIQGLFLRTERTPTSGSLLTPSAILSAPQPTAPVISALTSTVVLFVTPVSQTSTISPPTVPSTTTATSTVPSPTMVIPPSSAPTFPDRLASGKSLGPGDGLMSPNRKYFLTMQSDGNLVLYGPSEVDRQVVWQTRTFKYPNTILTNQDDGNLVLYAPGHTAICETHTAGKTNEKHINALVVQDDGNVVLYGPDKQVVWNIYDPLC